MNQIYKYSLLFFVLLQFHFLSVFAQSPPESFRYQAVVRNNSGQAIPNQIVSFQISIFKNDCSSASGFLTYQETHLDVETNLYGLVNLSIGSLDTASQFSSIDWSQGPFFILTELDIDGGSDSFTWMSCNQLMSVPYALYAKTSGGGPPGPVGPSGPSGLATLFSQTQLMPGDTNCPNGGILLQSGVDLDNNNILDISEVMESSYVCNGDAATNTDDQNLEDFILLPNNLLSLSVEDGAGVFVDLSPLVGTDDQIIDSVFVLNDSLYVSIENGNTMGTDLSSVLSNAGTDNQNLEDFILLPNNLLTLSIEDGVGVSVDLSSLIGSDNQQIQVFEYDSITQTILFELENGGIDSIQLSPFGLTGSQGPQGLQGIQGVTGADGQDGADGNDGTDGVDGATGAQGIQGVTGANGNDGVTGAQGIQGITGADGQDGADGTNGTDGVDGVTGAQGIQGVTGADGQNGADGTDGINGTDGVDGATGAQGIQGVTGADGQ
jgi:hypothetical protein